MVQVKPFVALRALVLFAVTVLLVAQPGCRRADAPAPRSTGPERGATRAPVTPPAVDMPEGSTSPRLTASADGRLVVSWLEPAAGGGAALRWSEWREAAWTPARTAVAAADVVVNPFDLPAVVPTGGGRLAAHWVARQGPTSSGTDVRVSTSIDDGATWSAPVVPHRDGTASEHGFATLFESRDGGLAAAWLDGRESASGQSAWSTRVMTTTLRPDGTLEQEALLDPRACDCCPVAVASAGGATTLAYRDRSDDEVRDVAVVRRPPESGWTAPAVPRADGWRVEGCPVNGPSLDAQGDRVALGWFTAAGDEPAAWVAVSEDAGHSFGEAVRVDDGRPAGHVDVVVAGDGSVHAGWVELEDAGTTFRVRRVTAPRDAPSPSRVVATLGSGPAAGRPQLERGPTGLVAAWTAPGAARVRVAPVP